MSDAETDGIGFDITEEELLRIIEIVEEFDPVVVGGQAVNLWVQFFRSSCRKSLQAINEDQRKSAIRCNPVVQYQNIA